MFRVVLRMEVGRVQLKLIGGQFDPSIHQFNTHIRNEAPGQQKGLHADKERDAPGDCLPYNGATTHAEVRHGVSIDAEFLKRRVRITHCQHIIAAQGEIDFATAAHAWKLRIIQTINQNFLAAGFGADTDQLPRITLVLPIGFGTKIQYW